MPVYFRKAKPFPRMGGGDCEKGKRISRKEEKKRNETDVQMRDCEMLQRCTVYMPCESGLCVGVIKR